MCSFYLRLERSLYWKQICCTIVAGYLSRLISNIIREAINSIISELADLNRITKIISLEEHFATKELMEGPGRNTRGPMETVAKFSLGVDPETLMQRLLDVGASRVAEMDSAGIDVQVLSLIRGIESIEDKIEALKFARTSNDFLADAVRQFPNRFAGFAILPVSAPESAADELERTVKEYGFKGAIIHGHSRGRYLDDSYFWPIFQRAQELGVPLYLHPAAPPEPVIRASYSGNFPQEITGLMATAGWGGHIDTAILVLRIIFSGALDRYPRLQLVIGHLGEGLPFMLPRIERMFPAKLTKLNRPIGAYFRENIHYTLSGFNFIQPFMDLLLQIGAERIMFSADYPYSSMREARDFLVNLPVSPHDRERIAHSNAEKLFRL